MPNDGKNPSEIAKKRIRYPADWIRRKESKEKISVVTAYDAAFARLVASTPVDSILVGDTLGMTVQGHHSTHPVTMEDILYHTRMVRRGAPDIFLVSDMPFGSYQCGEDEAVRNGIRLIKEGDASAVKLEGSTPETLRIIRRLVDAGVPVMAHAGLTPQSYLNTSGFRVQGRTEREAAEIRESAILLEKAGAFSIVLELVVAAVAERLTGELRIPTIGIGSGPGTSGQVLVLQDMLGMDADFQPKHSKRYADLASVVRESMSRYDAEVKDGTFPGRDHSFS